MKQVRYTLYICSLLLMLTACVEEIDLEHLRPDPKLVLNGVIYVGEPVIATVSRTWFHTEDYPNVTIENADVSLYANGEFKEKLIWNSGESMGTETGYYLADYCPIAGESIMIKASVEGYNEVSAEVILPEPVAISDYEVKHYSEYSDGYIMSYNKMALTFTDVPNRKDYYLIFFTKGFPIFDYEKEEYPGEYYWTYPWVDYAEEPLFYNDITAFDRIMGNDWLSSRYGRVFTDDLIDGETYTIKLRVDEAYYYGDNYGNDGDTEGEEAPPYRYRASLYTISKDYYDYLKTIISMEDGSSLGSLVDSGLAEPVRIKSNVKGGTGILGGGYKQEIEVMEIVE